MFRKILIANRGEIACRIIRTAKRLGVGTVAVYSDADAQARHVLMADEAVHIGPAPVRDSYLVAERIIAAARLTGAEAIHPGYGFLSENAGFARACAEAGIVFIGPPPAAIEAMGLKGAAKALMEKAKVPVVPGYHGDDQTPELLAKEAERIGYPVLIKAVAGGGGKGMRRVDTAQDFAAALAGAKREAANAFGDDKVLLEKYLVKPRHIEIQVFADAKGNAVHLFERDCSVQRRHQKVVEIAPAPNLDPELRDRICADAVKFAKHIGYVNAGTVEFLLDERGSYHFIEMNPRIQVEHTVTEQVTDRDLVIAQLRIAAGMTLPELRLRQEDVTISGAALQCRVTTEDPANGFRPDTGVISTYRSPGGPGVRLDGGTTHTGAEVSAHFDSLLVKLTCYGHDFANAVRRARRAIAEFRIRGVATNLPFLAAVLSDPDFAAGRITTSFIDERPHLLTARRPADRGTKLLTYLAETTVNKPNGPRPQVVEPTDKLPAFDASAQPPEGSRQLLRKLGPEGFALDFWKIAMRPGKPLIFGRLGRMSVLGLPGNPVSSLICAHVFLRPLVRRLGGRLHTPNLRQAELGAPMPANDGRRDYVRATVVPGPGGLIATPFPVQDSSMLSVLAAANALIIRQPHAPAAEAGERCQVLMLR